MSKPIKHKYIKKVPHNIRDFEKEKNKSEGFDILIISTLIILFLAMVLIIDSVKSQKPIIPDTKINCITKTNYVVEYITETNHVNVLDSFSNDIHECYNFVQHIPRVYHSSHIIRGDHINPIPIVGTNYYKYEEPITNGEYLRFDNKLPVKRN